MNVSGTSKAGASRSDSAKGQDRPMDRDAEAPETTAKVGPDKAAKSAWGFALRAFASEMERLGKVSAAGLAREYLKGHPGPPEKGEVERP
jgi:hypothetical protein